MNEECFECGRALCFQGCAHPLHQSETEKERERDRERKRERERKSERERKRERERKSEREYLFLKGMMGALAPFSYLVENILY